MLIMRTVKSKRWAFEHFMEFAQYKLKYYYYYYYYYYFAGTPRSKELANEIEMRWREYKFVSYSQTKEGKISRLSTNFYQFLFFVS